MSSWSPPDGLDAFLATAKQPLVVVLGPTASGKTSYSIRLAKHLVRAEIINADSRQVYRGMDIGTAKISCEEMQDVPHHLLSEVDPGQEITAAWYKTRAETVIADILSRGKIPMLVGGSMLYISAIIDGLEFSAPSDPGIRRAFSAAYEVDQGKTLHAELAKLDPESARKIPRQNKHYVIRALEKFQAGGSAGSQACPYDLFVIGMYVPVLELRKTIDDRTTKLVHSGWIEETRQLLSQGYNEHSPGFMSHGYREVLEWIQSGSSDDGSRIKTIAAKTRQYAKRQRTWWRDDTRIHWVTPSGTPAPGYGAAALD